MRGFVVVIMVTFMEQWANLKDLARKFRRK